MTREKLIQVLRECADDLDVEKSHVRADEALIEFINDPEIANAFKAVDKWYA